MLKGILMLQQHDIELDQITNSIHERFYFPMSVMHVIIRSWLAKHSMGAILVWSNCCYRVMRYQPAV
jgi:hypothetical protein